MGKVQGRIHVLLSPRGKSVSPGLRVGKKRPMEGRGCFLRFRHRLETNNVPQCEHMAASKKKSKHSVNTHALGEKLLLHSTVNEKRKTVFLLSVKTQKLNEQEGTRKMLIDTATEACCAS